MMQHGSRGDKNGWDVCPDWPPDVFAVAATLVDRSAAYTKLASDFVHLSDQLKQSEYANVAEKWRNNKWRKKGQFRSEKLYLQQRWALLAQSNERVCLVGSEQAHSVWVEAALELMIIADSACVGVGFTPTVPDHEDNWIERNYSAKSIEASEYSQGSAAAEQGAPYTACECVEESIACVQPKTRTPSVGCTLRSMTLHLALLPPVGVVKTRWNDVETDYDQSHSFNLLVVPFPYQIAGSAFKANELVRKSSKHVRTMFGVEQKWLQSPGLDVPELIVELIREAQREVEQIDGIVLPELAVDAKTYSQIARRLCEEPDIRAQFLISGVLGRVQESDPVIHHQEFKNTAVTTVFYAGGSEVAMVSLQKKHHRWKLDNSQITQYSLGDALNPDKEWWEFANIREREMSFYTFRKGACFTTLVCEDLARADPGQQVIRSIGPNLVFALLMDGPQKSARWPGRYAMVLADDPGSSILSVTSLGLIRRSNHHFDSAAAEVALWRDCSGTTRSLSLPAGAHGLVLSLTQQEREESTLDGRSDGGAAYHWLLSGSIPVTAKNSTNGLGY